MAQEVTDSPEITASAKIPFWYDPSKRAIIYQVVVLGLVGLVAYYLFSNTQANLERQNIATGFGFLSKQASFEIGESPIPYSAADTYARALLVGVLNTIKVSLIGVVLTVFFGTFVGIARLSKNWLVAKLAGIYIEVMQDIPVLLQLVFWYAVFYDTFPPPRQALNPINGVYLCNRGMVFTAPQAHPVYGYMALAFVAGCLAVWVLHRWAKRRQEKTGQSFPLFPVSLAILLLLPLATWLVGGAPLKMNAPKLVGFNFEGGITLSPEFAALLLGLVLYTAAFVAEIVRAGIQAISRGQESSHVYRVEARPSLAACHPTSGPQGDHSTTHQSNVESHQEQHFSHCHRLPRLRGRGQHHYQPDGPGYRGCRHDHGGVSLLQSEHLGLHELV